MNCRAVMGSTAGEAVTAMADLRRVPPTSLSSLMALASAPGDWGWGARDLGDILGHQLQMPLPFAAVANEAPATDARGPHAAAAITFEGLLTNPEPPLELLRLTKEYAKTADQPPEGGVPPEVATVLYYAAIAAAVLRCGERISRVDDPTLRDGITWALRQQWVGEPLRSLFLDAQSLHGAQQRPVGGPEHETCLPNHEGQRGGKEQEQEE